MGGAAIRVVNKPSTSRGGKGGGGRPAAPVSASGGRGGTTVSTAQRTRQLAEQQARATKAAEVRAANAAAKAITDKANADASMRAQGGGGANALMRIKNKGGGAEMEGPPMLSPQKTSAFPSQKTSAFTAPPSMDGIIGKQMSGRSAFGKRGY